VNASTSIINQHQYYVVGPAKFVFRSLAILEVIVVAWRARMQ